MSRQKKIEARYASYKRLANNHPDEFHGYMAEEYRDRGLEYDRPLTEEEKALATVRELIAKYPSLQGKVAPVVVTTSGFKPGEHYPGSKLAEADEGEQVDDDAELPPDHNL